MQSSNKNKINATSIKYNFQKPKTTFLNGILPVQMYVHTSIQHVGLLYQNMAQFVLCLEFYYYYYYYSK